jgi:hypothetical protein
VKDVVWKEGFEGEVVVVVMFCEGKRRLRGKSVSYMRLAG